MVDELISDLSAETNFSEITAPLASFEEMTKSVPEEAPLWKLSCALELFSAEKVIERTRPNPRRIKIHSLFGNCPFRECEREGYDGGADGP